MELDLVGAQIERPAAEHVHRLCLDGESPGAGRDAVGDVELKAKQQPQR
jgi:hypothetical protein